MVLPTNTSGAHLLINLDAIAENYRLIQREAAGIEVAAVVKADAYGLGMAEIAPALFEAGCRTFFTATPEEGLELRNILPNADVHVFNGPMPGVLEDMIKNRITPVLNSPAQAQLWAEKLTRHQSQTQTAPLADLHVDTGMNRLGFTSEELKIFEENSSFDHMLRLDVVMSHLACSNDPAHEMNEAQRIAFERTTKNFISKRRSLAASSGIFLGDQYHFNLVRPGIALYGGNPQPGTPNPMAQVVRIQGKILQVRSVDTPQSVGYGASYTVKSPARIATVAIGYADGYLRSFSNSGKAWIDGHEVHVAGRVSMDLTTLDVTSVPPHLSHTGALVDFLGPDQSIDQMAEDAGTIEYEVLARLGNRFARQYSKRMPD